VLFNTFYVFYPLYANFLRYAISRFLLFCNFVFVHFLPMLASVRIHKNPADLVIALAIYWGLRLYEISFTYVQIWHFCCTMSRVLLFCGHSI